MMAPRSRQHKFMRDLGLYAVGNIGSKLVTFLLVPFYTFFISDPADFGYYDVCLAVVFGLTSLISLQLQEGGFRFLIETDARLRQRAIVSFIVRVLLANSLLTAGLGLVLSMMVEIHYLWYIIAFGIAQAFIDSWTQIVRGLGRMKVYVNAAIFNSLAIALFSVLTVAVLDMGVPGIFLANIAARLLTLLYIELKVRIVRAFMSLSAVSSAVSHELVRYSLPLLPMILFWWVLNNNGIFFIKEFLGLEENGIYAILTKFTGILYVLATIFYQTWQQNAIEQYNSPDRDRFFSAVFNNYLLLLCFLVSVFPFALRLNYGWLVSAEYYQSSQYLFANSVFMMGFAVSSFFELGYQCAKKTTRILPGVLLAMVVNVVGNRLMVPVWGIYGLIAVNILTFMLLIVYRAIDTRKYMRISFSPRNYLSLLLTAGAGALFYLSSSPIVDLASLLAIILLFLLLTPKSTLKSLSKSLTGQP